MPLGIPNIIDTAKDLTGLGKKKKQPSAVPSYASAYADNQDVMAPGVSAPAPSPVYSAPPEFTSTAQAYRPSTPTESVTYGGPADTSYSAPSSDGGGLYGDIKNVARTGVNMAKSVAETEIKRELQLGELGIKALSVPSEQVAQVEVIPTLHNFEKDENGKLVRKPMFGVPTWGEVQNEARRTSQEKIPGVPGVVAGEVAAAALDPVNVIGAGFTGKGLVADLLGRGEQSLKAYAASVAAASAASGVVGSLSDSPGLNLVAGLGASMLAGGALDRTPQRVPDNTAVRDAARLALVTTNERTYIEIDDYAVGSAMKQNADARDTGIEATSAVQDTLRQSMGGQPNFITARTLVLDAVDRVRGAADGGRVMATYDGDYVGIDDSGPGMRPDDLRRAYLDTADAAHAAMFGAADDIVIESTTLVGDTYVHTTIEGSGADWLAGKMKVTTKRSKETIRALDEGEGPTGTSVLVKQPKDPRAGWESVDGHDKQSHNKAVAVWMNRFEAYSTAPGVKFQKHVRAELDTAPREETHRFVELTPNAAISELPGKVYLSHIIKDIDTVNVHVLKDGVYQFTQSAVNGRMGFMPTDMVVDLPDAKFISPTRLDQTTQIGLDRFFKTTFKEMVNRASRAQWLEHLDTAPRIPDSNQILMDSTGTTRNGDLARIGSRSYMQKVSPAMENVYNTIATSFPGAEGRTHFQGWDLNMQWFGFHLHRNYTELGDMYGGGVLLNPFAHLRKAENDVGKLTPGTMATTPRVRERFVANLIGTAVHEATHTFVLGHGDDFNQFLTEYIRNTTPMMGKLYDDLLNTINDADIEAMYDDFFQWEQSDSRVRTPARGAYAALLGESDGRRQPAGEAGVNQRDWLRHGLEGDVPRGSEVASEAGSAGATNGGAGPLIDKRTLKPKVARGVEPPANLAAAIDQRADAIFDAVGAYPPGDPIAVARFTGGGGMMGNQALADMANVMDAPDLTMADIASIEPEMSSAKKFSNGLRARFNGIENKGGMEFGGSVVFDVGGSRLSVTSVFGKDSNMYAVGIANEAALNSNLDQNPWQSRNPETADLHNLLSLRGVMTDLLRQNPGATFVMHPTDSRRARIYEKFGFERGGGKDPLGNAYWTLNRDKFRAGSLKESIGSAADDADELNDILDRLGLGDGTGGGGSDYIPPPPGGGFRYNPPTPPPPPEPTVIDNGPTYGARRYSRELGSPQQLLLPRTAPLTPGGRRINTDAVNPRESADVLRQLLMKYNGTINYARNELKQRVVDFMRRDDVRKNKAFWQGGGGDEIRFLLDEGKGFGDLPPALRNIASDFHDYLRDIEARDTQYNAKWGKGWSQRAVDILDSADETALANLDPDTRDMLTAYRGVERDFVQEYWPGVFKTPKGGWDNFFNLIYGKSQPGAREFNQRRRQRVVRDPLTGDVRQPTPEEYKKGYADPAYPNTVLTGNAADLQTKAGGTLNIDGTHIGGLGDMLGDTPPLKGEVGPEQPKPSYLRRRTIREAIDIFGLEFKNKNPMEDLIARDIAGQRRIAKDIMMRRMKAWGVAKRVLNNGQVDEGWAIPKVWGFAMKNVYDINGNIVRQEAYQVPQSIADLLNDAFDVNANQPYRKWTRVGAKIAGQVKLLNFVLAGAQHVDVGIMRPIGSKMNLSTIRGKAHEKGLLRAAATPLEIPYVWASNALVASPVLGRPFRTRLQREWGEGFLGELVNSGANVRATQDYAAGASGEMIKQLTRFPLIGGAVDFKLPGIEQGSIPDNFVKAPVHLLNAIQGELSEGLFNGLYLNMAKHVSHDMFNSLSASHPEWNRQQLLNATANNLNLIMGSVDNWDSMVSNEGVRDGLRILLTSVSENEGFMRMFARGMAGLWDSGDAVLRNTTDRVVDTRSQRNAAVQFLTREKKLGELTVQPEIGRNRAADAMSGYWQNYWAGYAVSLFMLAQVVNYSTTGEWLGEDQLWPFEDLGSGGDFNSKFLRPIIGFTPLGQPIYMDFFGQMDTPLRWAFSPDKAIKNRLSSTARFAIQAYNNKSYDGRTYSDNPNRWVNAAERIYKSGWEAVQPISANNIQEATDLNSTAGMIASGLSLNAYAGGLPELRDIESKNRYGKKFDDLDPQQQEVVRNLPNVQTLRKQQQDYYAKRGDVSSVAAEAARNEVYAELDNASAFWKDGGYLRNPDAQKLPDKMHDASMRLMGQRDQREALLAAVGKDYSDFNDKQVDKDLTEYFAILPRTEDGAVNWQESIKQRDALVEKFRAADPKRARDIELMLDVLEGRRHPVMQQFRADMKALDAANYPFGVKSSGATEAFQATNPQADLIMWKWYGSALNSVEGVQKAFAAMDAGTTKMPVKLSGVGRRLDLDRAEWEANGERTYTVWSSIKDTENASAATIKERILKASPTINARLLYWGFGTERLYTPAARVQLAEMMKDSSTVDPRAWNDKIPAAVTVYYSLTGTERKQALQAAPRLEGYVAAWRYFMFSTVPSFSSQNAMDEFIRLTGINPMLVRVDPRKEQ